MNDQKPCRQDLLDWINAVSFAADDVKLFLDLHPCHTEALEYFAEVKRQRVQALKEYAKYYGPLTVDTASDCEETWMWAETPWPWQEGGC